MSTVTYTIQFDFLVDAARLNITLEADVQEHHSDTYYVITNFRIPGHGSRPVLPDITVQKKNGVWVHTDSGQSTNLSTTVGNVIETRGR